MKLTMPGTGNALVTECYHTCFLIEENGQLFMVDGGGRIAVLCRNAEKTVFSEGKAVLPRFSVDTR